VHPLLLAIGSERYVPYAERAPRELLTLASAILGFGQCSLAKYLLIVAREDAPDLDIDDVGGFLAHLLERIDWRRDLHFQTQTTIDTLDYSGTSLNAGSKVVMAAAGPKTRELGREVPAGWTLPDGFGDARLALPGVLLVRGPAFSDSEAGARSIERLVRSLEEGGRAEAIESHPLIVVVDEPEFAARKLANFVWVAFTRSNPSHDVHGVGAFVEHKHWGCRGPLVIDARIKPHHAPPLVEDPDVTRRVDALAAPGRPLHGIY
jgi:4-hydroxy-3-polyprenylbenzoate decarboxylase